MLRTIRNSFVKYLPQSQAGRIGCVALLAAALLAWVDLRLAAIPLGVFMAVVHGRPVHPDVQFFPAGDQSRDMQPQGRRPYLR